MPQFRLGRKGTCPEHAIGISGRNSNGGHIRPGAGDNRTAPGLLVWARGSSVVNSKKPLRRGPNLKPLVFLPLSELSEVPVSQTTDSV